MKFAAGVLIVVLAPWAALPPRVPAALPPSPLLPVVPVLPDLPSRDWLAEPDLPSCFRSVEPEPVELSWPEEALTLDVPPLHALAAPAWQDLGARADEPEAAESSFPKGVGAPEIEAWRREDELRQLREWASDALLGVPMLVPQLILEGLLPRGIAVGPSTFLYRKESNSLAFVVLDQILFHEAEFVAGAQGWSMNDTPYPENYLQSGQRRVLRRSLMGGFRASYAIPGLTMDLVLQTAADHGIAGYLLAPPVGGALLYFKGIDQKFRIHEQVKIRCKIGSGREWIRAVHSDGGYPVFSFEVKFCDLPLGLIASFDASTRGLIPEFIGIGTSLDAVEQLLGAEKAAYDPSYRIQ